MSEETNMWNNIEKKWLDYWEKNLTNTSDPDPNQKKYFITVAYPYPNSPQHIGHGRTYTIADTHARYKKLKGYNVLFPMAFHYTGTPILGMSKRVIAGDREIIENFKSIYKIDDKIIETFRDPLEIAKYFHDEIKKGMMEMGYSIDWRREFTTIDPVYKKFIAWQFETLKRLGVIEQGSHPVGWCPNDNNPVSQHDTLGDVEPAFTEYTMVKFKLTDEDIYLPTATLRPETLFGVTNLWINPTFEYLVVRINEKEKWIMTEESFNKLRFLNFSVEIVRTIQGSEIAERFVENPIDGSKIPVLPARFVTFDEGSGIVMSVPAHAPFDMQALIDLKMSQTTNRLIDIVPITIIESNLKGEISSVGMDANSKGDGTQTAAGFSFSDLDIPSLVMLKKYSIKEQSDPNLEKATSDLYTLEFYSGKMNNSVLNYSGMPVPKARDEVKFDLLRQNKAILFYELTNKPVICRCGTKCYVKLLDNQWFLNYGNPKWKRNAFECLESMEILPEEIIREFKNVFDWLKFRACARKSGLGTPLPWDTDWIIESLSDSVIYMIYYLVAKYVNLYNLENYLHLIDNSFFDYILLNKPEEYFKEELVKLDKEFSQSSDLKKSDNTELAEFKALANNIKNEFDYYYPLDSRHSGRDLVPNHLSFFIFNHSIIFQKSQWPKQIVVNGSVLMDGKKMSKSMGNIIPLRSTIRQFSADSIRVAMLILGELLQDVDFSFTTLRGIYTRLNEIFYFGKAFLNENKQWINDISFEDYLRSQEKNNLNLEDLWLLHRLNSTITEISGALDEMRIRDSLNNVLYLMDKDFEWYKKRKLSKLGLNLESDRVYKEITYLFLKVRIIMLSPFCPFLTEELWALIDKSGKSVFNGNWPLPNPIFNNYTTEENEKHITNILNDLEKILKVTKNSNPERVYIYLSSKQKTILYHKILEIVKDTNSRNFGLIMKTLLSDTSLTSDQKKFIQQNSELIKKINQDLLSLSPSELLNRQKMNNFDELLPLQDAKSLLAKEIGIKESNFVIYSEDEPGIIDPKNKARISRPFKPALYVE
ncbi:MAG TPA: leucine--tRNA ligase [Candidatus Nitrosocosmicus sp.]|nr:leucine--tRNA ligase [Candidatus Nitrosocosmicus sp.]